MESADFNSPSPRRIISLLLTRVSEFNISKEAVIVAARRTQQFWSIAYDRDLQVQLIKYLARDRKIAISEELWRDKESWNAEMIAILLDSDPSVNITEKDLLTAAQNGRREVVGITQDTLLALASDASQGMKVMEMLLATDLTIRITETHVLAVAKYHDVRVMEMLLTREPTIRITEEHLLVVATNEGHGVELMEMLLARDPNIAITERLLVATGEYDDERMMQTLLTSNPNIAVTVDSFRAISGCGGDGDCEMMSTLLHGARNIVLTEEIMLTVVRSGSDSAIQCFLGHDRKILINEEALLLWIQRNEWDSRMLEMLVSRAARSEITERVLLAALSMPEDNGDDYQCSPFHDLVRARGPGITEAVVAAAIGKAGSALSLMKILVAYDPNIRTTEGVMVAAAGNVQEGEEMMRVLLSRNPDIIISNEVMTVAMKNQRCGKELVMVLLERDMDFENTQERGILLEMVVARTFGSEFVTIVIPRNLNTPAAMMVVREEFPDQADDLITSIELLRGSDITITETVMAAAANNWDYSTNALKMLLRRDPNIKVTDEALRKAAGDQECDPELLEMLLDRQSIIECTEALTSIGSSDAS